MPDLAEHHTPSPPPDPGLSICVLASGSSGNCTALVHRAEQGSPRRVVLIDAGLSPRRTARLLAQRGIPMHEVDDIVFTHLDTDHCHRGWASAVCPGGWRARFRIHERHLGRAERAGLLFNTTVPFDDTLSIDGSLRARSTMLSHDDLGVAAFRFDAVNAKRVARIGFATDLGRATHALAGLLGGVDLLAIESNYCPDMQACSDRPDFLKRRITGGSGHLSNHEAAQAVARIAPRERVVLLHLSRQCNTPEAALRAHRLATCPVELSSQVQPTRWFHVQGRALDNIPLPVAAGPRAQTLFDLESNDGAAW
ncbi:MAG: MBL fold metallo-hydrolase [Planctomycetota bacterium]